MYQTPKRQAETEGMKGSKEYYEKVRPMKNVANPLGSYFHVAGDDTSWLLMLSVSVAVFGCLLHFLRSGWRKDGAGKVDN